VRDGYFAGWRFGAHTSNLVGDWFKVEQNAQNKSLAADLEPGAMT
jgi:hypothetical protein